uniref:Uncharacterized protein n=1 Tax=Candidozyma auris TaxID=498019 RepID=A0A0L0P5U3_CANAR
MVLVPEAAEANLRAFLALAFMAIMEVLATLDNLDMLSSLNWLVLKNYKKASWHLEME